MEAPDDGLEVVNGEGKRVKGTVPTDDVEGVPYVTVKAEPGTAGDEDIDLRTVDEQAEPRARKSRSLYGAPSLNWPRWVR